jgi:hypothetical protein
MVFDKTIPPTRITAEMMDRINALRRVKSNENSKVMSQGALIRQAITASMKNGDNIPTGKDGYGKLTERTSIILVQPAQMQYVQSIAVHNMTGVSQTIRDILALYLSKEGV